MYCKFNWAQIFCLQSTKDSQHKPLVTEIPAIPMIENRIPMPKGCNLTNMQAAGFVFPEETPRPKYVKIELPKGWKFYDGSKSKTYLRYYIMDEKGDCHVQIYGAWPQTRETKKLITLWNKPPIHVSKLDHPMLTT